ncbi:MAG: 4-hydroxy-tetrahydrodipicolinate reductase [Tissierellia bacterium]|nr:4-hydroxy-tetrahydrodipicolinate reductase [Tissierellia bacterium]MDD4780027.1 4-hydroxy-tetrahydrodipicolinate reductase [Tissierellia bacterium]
MKLIIIAPKGKMGRLITKVSSEINDFEIVAGVGHPGKEYIGQDIGMVAGLGRNIGASVVDNLEDVINECDVIIDFSNIELSMKVVDMAVKYKKSLVCGTTGFTDDNVKKIYEASQQIPLLFASNTSRVVNLMNTLLEITSKIIGNISDIEIIEMHDAFKKDAPSGTSKEMGEIIAHAMEKELKDIAVYGREGAGERKLGSIGYHSVRAGDISSSHTVMFGLMGERLEITHHAYNWECFARGACEGALFLKDKGPGLYEMKDVLKL